jgi:hypothetical protein
VDELEVDTMRDIETRHPDTELSVRFRQHRRARDLTRGRRLVVVDIENVVGGPCNTAARTRWAHRRLRDAVGLGSTDQIVVGVDASGLESVLLSRSTDSPVPAARTAETTRAEAMADGAASTHVLGLPP